jgi:hypothetical protein
MKRPSGTSPRGERRAERPDDARRTLSGAEQRFG